MNQRGAGPSEVGMTRSSVKRQRPDGRGHHRRPSVLNGLRVAIARIWRLKGEARPTPAAPCPATHPAAQDAAANTIPLRRHQQDAWTYVNASGVPGAFWTVLDNRCPIGLTGTAHRAPQDNRTCPEPDST